MNERKNWESIPEEEKEEETIERLKEPIGGKILICEKPFGGFNVGDVIKTKKEKGVFKVKLFDPEKSNLVKGENWIEVKTGEDFEDFSNSFVLKEKEKNSEPVLAEGAAEEPVVGVGEEAGEEKKKIIEEKVEPVQETAEIKTEEPESAQEKNESELNADIKENTSMEKINKMLKEFQENKTKLRIKEGEDHNFIIIELPKRDFKEYVELQNINEEEDIRTISRDVLYDLNPEAVELREAVREEVKGLNDQRRQIIEELERLENKGYVDKEKQQELGEELERVEMMMKESEPKENFMDQFSDGEKVYVFLKRIAIGLEKKRTDIGNENIVDEIWKLTTEEDRGKLVDMMVDFAIENNLSKDEIRDLSTIVEPTKHIGRISTYKWLYEEAETPTERENLEYEKTARKGRNKLWDFVTETNEEIADNPEIPDEEMKDLEDKGLKGTVRAVMSDVNLGSYEKDPEKRKEVFGAAVEAMEASLLRQKLETEKAKTKLIEAKRKAVEKFGVVSGEEIIKIVSEKGSRQTGESKKGDRWKGLFNYLGQKLRRNSAEEENKEKEKEFKDDVAMEFLKILKEDGELKKELLKNKNLGDDELTNIALPNDIKKIAEKLSEKYGGDTRELEKRITEIRFERKYFEKVRKNMDLNEDAIGDP